MPAAPVCRPIFLLLLLCCLYRPVETHAQLDPETRARLISERARYYEKYNGLPLPEFTATTQDGKTITKYNTRGKITLFLLWYPMGSGMSHMKYQADHLNLGRLPGMKREYPDFQIISLLADTVGLAKFRIDNPEIDNHMVANLQSHTKSQEITFGGNHRAVLVDRYGTIVRMSELGNLLDEEGIANKVRELSMR